MTFSAVRVHVQTDRGRDRDCDRKISPFQNTSSPLSPIPHRRNVLSVPRSIP